MPKIEYQSWNPRGDSLTIVERAIEICTDFRARGYDLTLRQLYYQFVAKALIPNNQKSYNRLGEIINNARLAGLMDWNFITDRTRNLAGNSHWQSPSSIIDAVAAQYRIDHWVGQPERVEVWVEKEALAGIVGQAAGSRDCDYFACRGYVSQSEMWSAAQRIRRYIEAGQRVTILHLGDHDPSGMDMSRDIQDRLTMFLARHLGSMALDLTVERIALNMDQVEQYDPPPNPAKLTDSRATDYIDQYGDESWELDALDPDTLVALITDKIEEHLDRDLYQERLDQQSREKYELQGVSIHWEEVVEFVEDTFEN